MKYIFNLSWPPSVNKYWRHPTKGKLAGRHLISEEGRRYRSRTKRNWKQCWRNARGEGLEMCNQEVLYRASLIQQKMIGI